MSVNIVDNYNLKSRFGTIRELLENLICNRSSLEDILEVVDRGVVEINSKYVDEVFIVQMKEDSKYFKVTISMINNGGWSDREIISHEIKQVAPIQVTKIEWAEIANEN